MLSLVTFVQNTQFPRVWESRANAKKTRKYEPFFTRFANVATRIRHAAHLLQQDKRHTPRTCISKTNGARHAYLGNENGVRSTCFGVRNGTHIAPASARGRAHGSAAKQYPVRITTAFCSSVHPPSAQSQNFTPIHSVPNNTMRSAPNNIMRSDHNVTNALQPQPRQAFNAPRKLLA